jgi:hypothetical protein
MKSSALAHNFLFTSMIPNATLPYQKILQIQLHPNSIKSLSSIILNKMNLNQGLPLLPIHMAIAPTSPTTHKTFHLSLPPLPNPLHHNGLNFIEMIHIELTPD